MKICLVACVKLKATSQQKARDLYTSTLFKSCVKYAEKYCDSFYILSAKYGLLAPTILVEPYNDTLLDKVLVERRKWFLKVITELDKIVKEGDTLVFLAGEKYREYLQPYYERKGIKTEVPLEGLGIGKQLQKLKQII